MSPSTPSPAPFSIARFTVLEARRTRLPLVACGWLVGAALVAWFAAGLAVTDAAAYRVGLYAALARLGMVLLTVLFVATSVARELEDRMLDLTLSRPVSRAAWYGGRLAGFVAVVVVAALAAAAPLCFGAAPARVVAWALTLVAELTVMAAITLTAALTLRQLPVVVSAALAFYVLARAMDALVLMSHGPAVDPTAWSDIVIGKGLALLALVVPPLSRFADSDWLIQGTAVPALSACVLETLSFVVLVAAVGLFDLYRLNE